MNTFGIVPTKEKIAEMRERHIARYTNMANSRSPNVRIYECCELIAIWGSTEGRSFDELSPRARAEVEDAFLDEEGL